MEKGIAIRLLVVDESANTPDEIADALRNAGFSVHIEQAANQDALQKALKKNSWDLIIVSPKTKDLDASQALSLIHQSGKDIPCIVFDHEHHEHPDAWFKAGALDIVSDNNLDHLVFVARREIDNLRKRRDYRRYLALYHESQKRNEALLSNSRDPIAYIHEGTHIHGNQSYLDFFACNSPEDLESTPLMDLIASDHRKLLKEVLQNIDSAQPGQTCELNVIRAENEICPVMMELSHTSIKGKPCIQLTIRQQDNSVQLEQEIRQLRQQDLLTGLYNYPHFINQLQIAVDKASQDEEEYALLYIELENFNNIKKNIGLSASHVILADIASILQTSISTGAIIAHYDNAIFTVLLNQEQLPAREQIAGDIVQRIAEKTFETTNGNVRVTCNIGISRIGETADSVNNILTHAESACIQAQNDRDIRIFEFSELEDPDTLEADRDMVPLIMHALKENRFILQFQPIVSLHAEPGDRYEALIRMLDDNDNVIMPGEFLGSAQRANLMVEIDRWVIKSAAKAMLKKRKMEQEIQFFVKISPESLNDSSTLIWISKLLKTARLHGESIVFEISEYVAINNLKATKRFANGLKQLHCRFALDHAGRAGDDFSYLQDFDVDYLKIDGSRIQDIKSDASQEIIRKIVETARSRKFQTIAEHVQDPDCLATLWMQGVNFIQGYYLQPPESSLNFDFSNTNQ